MRIGAILVSIAMSLVVLTLFFVWRTDATQQPIADDQVKHWHRIEDFPDQQIAQFETVFWEPRDTESLRQLIRDTSLVQNKTVLEIGTGTGLISLCCLRAGASRVVATDINPAAIANVRFNVEQLQLDERLELRTVPLDDPGAFSIVGETEQFDLIISNPPWENQRPQSIDQYALYDEDFALMRSLLAGLKEHLAPGGKALLAYGCVDAIKTLCRLAPEYKLQVRQLDDRHLDDLSEVFLPGMLIQVKPLVSTESDPN